MVAAAAAKGQGRAQGKCGGRGFTPPAVYCARRHRARAHNTTVLYLLWLLGSSIEISPKIWILVAIVVIMFLFL